MSMRRGVGEYEGNGNKRGVAKEERGTICTTKIRHTQTVRLYD